MLIHLSTFKMKKKPKTVIIIQEKNSKKIFSIKIYFQFFYIIT